MGHICTYTQNKIGFWAQCQKIPILQSIHTTSFISDYLILYIDLWQSASYCCWSFMVSETHNEMQRSRGQAGSEVSKPSWFGSWQGPSQPGVLGNGGTGWGLLSAGPLPTAHFLYERSPEIITHTTACLSKWSISYITKMSTIYQQCNRT